HLLLCVFSTSLSPSDIYTLSLHDALPIWKQFRHKSRQVAVWRQIDILRRDDEPVAIEKLERDRVRVRLRICECNTHVRSSRLGRSEEHTSELQSRFDLVCRLLLEKKKQIK